MGEMNEVIMSETKEEENSEDTVVDDDDDDDDDEAKDREELKQNFLPIHQDKKRLPQPISVTTLCPTMDLAAVGLHKKTTSSSAAAVNKLTITDPNDGKENLSNNYGSKDKTNNREMMEESSLSANNDTDMIEIFSSNTIIVYRTMKWEKMFVVNQADASNALSSKQILDDASTYRNRNKDINTQNEETNEAEGNGTDSVIGNNDTSISHLTWSPDGRTLVFGLSNGSILLYDIESSASPGVSPRPAVYIPSAPPASNALLFQEENRSIDNNDVNKSNDFYKGENNSPSSSSPTTKSTKATRKKSVPNYSPAVTRSMAAARRKKLDQMIAKSHENTVEKSATNDLSPNADRAATAPLSSSSQLSIKAIQNLKTKLKTHKNTIVSLQWQRIRPSYKDWDINLYEQSQEESWYYQSHYLDKATHFLPPCTYNSTYPKNNGNSFDDVHGTMGGLGASSIRQASENLDHHPNDFEESIDRYRPRCQTPLSILFSVTCGSGIHLYLQGRFRILSIPSPVIALCCNRSTSITASSDLSMFVICSTKSVQHKINDGNSYSTVIRQEDNQSHNNHDQNHPKYPTYQKSPALVLYTIPQLIKKRYQLQIISSSYCSIISHLTTLHGGIKEIAGAWSGSLRQLDTKFDQLSNLLTKYGVMPSDCNTTIQKMTIVRRELMNYILSGHSTRCTNTSNAMDQFFTDRLMNDQLLQRLVRSLESNVAGVEGIIRKKMLGPVRALMYDVGELHGLVKAMNLESTGNGFGYGSFDYSKEDNIDADELDYDLPLMNEQTSLRLYEASEVLFFVSEQCVSQLVEIRFRLSCMMKWIRGTSSQVKARGTAIDSVQRENAKKRRVPEQTVRKIADFLSTPFHYTEEEDDGEMNKPVKRGASECILGILFSDYFCKSKVSIEAAPTPLVPKNLNSSYNLVETPSVKAALEISTQIALDLFEEPRLSLRKSLNQTRIIVHECLKDKDVSTEEFVIAVHNRIGVAPHSARHVEGCFNPNVIVAGIDEVTSRFSQNWIIIANTCTSKSGDKNILQISALPDINSYSELDDIEQEMSGRRFQYYLTTFIILPNDSHITSIKFYGNDGNSTLTSETSPNNEEGKQELSLMLRKSSGEEELWLFDYEEIDFRMVNLPSDVETHLNGIPISKFDPNVDQLCLLYQCNQTLVEDDETADGAICAKWRSIKEESKHTSTSHLVVSGSRAVGGIICERTNTFQFFDFEEDDDDESEE